MATYSGAHVVHTRIRLHQPGDPGFRVTRKTFAKLNYFVLTFLSSCVCVWCECGCGYGVRIRGSGGRKVRREMDS